MPRRRFSVEPQVEVCRAGALIARLDLANEELCSAVEYDGEEWHSSPAQVAHDRARRDEVRGEGWLVEAVTKEHVFGRARECEAIIRDLRRRARARRGRRTAC